MNKPTRIALGAVTAVVIAAGTALTLALPAQANAFLRHDTSAIEDGTNDGETNDDGVEDGTNDGETNDD
ncbi:hypothetical protein BH11ACT3_BH11ACT3_23640 [soil metagenome]